MVKDFFERCDPKVGGHYYNDQTWEVNIILGLNSLEKIVQFKKKNANNASLPRCTTMAEIHGELLPNIGDNDHKIQESEKLQDES